MRSVWKKKNIPRVCVGILEISYQRAMFMMQNKVVMIIFLPKTPRIHPNVSIALMNLVGAVGIKMVFYLMDRG
jgi:hypothetical protein